MLGNPNRVVIGSVVPEIWIKTEDGRYSLNEVTIITAEELESNVELAFSNGITVVTIFQPDITRSLH